ncbi:hypothetical protein F4808DRAFT_442248 [Astrocystis sublimbata]|nr:hypothetical protein F4808DRAFT_442248 [Astrocystis sublimbata]
MLITRLESSIHVCPPCLSLHSAGTNLTMSRTLVGDGDKELVMKHLILGSCKLIHEHGANLVPADMEYYSKTGMPDADRALLRGAKLSMAEESIHGEKGTDTTSEPERDNNGRIIHGKPRWPPNVAICRRPLEVDENGRVDLQHDPYCLRDHFTTRWGVLKEHVSRAPQGGGIIEWSDYNLSIEAEGEDAGLGVNTDVPFRSREAYEKRVSLVDLISSPLLLYRVTANFAAPPQTHNAAYKQAWSFTLWNVEDPKCYLVIEESKGVPQAYFCGGKKASAEACQLLEWLTGTNCPHPYDYTPCGRYA